MSNGEDLFTPRDDPTSPPSFEVALRGYDKRQVERYAEQVDIQLSRLTADRDRAYGHIQDLTAQLRQTQAEIAELRQRPPQLDRATFRDLGPTVDQMLALAEKQSGEITEAATQRAADLQAEAQRVLAQAREQAERLRADSEAAHDYARQETEAARAQAHQELTEIRTNVEREIDERREAMAQLQAELDTAQQQLAQARQEVGTAEQEFHQLQQQLGETRRDLAGELDRLDEARRAADTAEQHATAVRARVQREAKRVADLAAAAVLAAAERGGETGEYPMVVPVQRRADHSTAEHAGLDGTAGEPVDGGRATADHGGFDQVAQHALVDHALVDHAAVDHAPADSATDRRAADPGSAADGAPVLAESLFGRVDDRVADSPDSPAGYHADGRADPPGYQTNHHHSIT